jgi:Uroporphyrinogen-III synthase
LPLPLLITRPKDDAERLAEELRALVPELSVILAPVLEIRPLPFDLPDEPFDLVLISSQHAIPAALSCDNLPVVCVGAATARKAEVAGLTVRAVFPTADDLVRGLADQKDSRALHLHGYHTRGNVSKRLTAAGLETKECVVYDQIARSWTTAEQSEIFDQPQLLVPLYSPRSAQILSENLAGYTGELTLIAISEVCREAWSGPLAKSICVAEHPDGEIMKQVIASKLS